MGLFNDFFDLNGDGKLDFAEQMIEFSALTGLDRSIRQKQEENDDFLGGFDDDDEEENDDLY